MHRATRRRAIGGGGNDDESSRALHLRSKAQIDEGGAGRNLTSGRVKIPTRDKVRASPEMFEQEIRILPSIEPGCSTTISPGEAGGIRVACSHTASISRGLRHCWLTKSAIHAEPRSVWPAISPRPTAANKAKPEPMALLRLPIAFRSQPKAAATKTLTPGRSGLSPYIPNPEPYLPDNGRSRKSSAVGRQRGPRRKK